MTPSDDAYESLLPPWHDWEAIKDDTDELVSRLETQARAAKDVASDAAIGLVVAVGNYEFEGEARSEVLDPANALLHELDPERSKYWG